MLKPEGRVVMVSGAARGLGRAVADTLFDAGFVLSLAARDLPALDAAAAGWNPSRVMTCHFDAVEPESQAAWVDATVRRFGRIDALVNNAGLIAPFSIETFEGEEGLDLMWEVNVKAPARLIHLVLPQLRRCGSGRVVNIASLSGKRVRGGFEPGYAITKHALMALTHAVRQLGWDDGVRATAICPSFIDTEMISHVDTGEEPILDPGDVAELVLTALSFENRASLPEIWINCRLEDAV